MRLSCYIPNFVKIGLPVQKLLVFLFLIEMHGKVFFGHFGVNKFAPKFLTPKSIFLSSRNIDILCVKIGSVVWAVLQFMDPDNG